MIRTACSTAILVLLISAAHAQSYDIDMRPGDVLGSQGGSRLVITRPSSNLGAGPQLDLSGPLGDTLSGGASGSSSLCSAISCGYGIDTSSNGSSSRVVDEMRKRDSLR